MTAPNPPDFASLAASWSPYGGALTPADRADLETMLRDAYAAGLRDATLDWSRLSPRQQWEALRGAPKVAGPWEQDWTWERSTPDGHLAATGFPVGPSAAEVPDRAAADAALVAAGWVLCDGEEST